MSDAKQLGSFKAKATDGGWGAAKTGTEQCGVAFKILEEGAYQNRVFTWYGFMNSKENAERTIKALQTCGCTFPDNDVNNLAGLDANEVEITLEEDVYEGKTRIRVGFINPLGGGVRMATRFDENQQGAFKSRFAGLIQQAKQNAPLSAAKPGVASTKPGQAPAAPANNNVQQAAGGDKPPF